MDVPATISQFEVIEYGYFPAGVIVASDAPPSDGDSAKFQRVHSVAICRGARSQGFYTLYCTRKWEFVAGEYSDTLDAARETPLRTCGQTVPHWLTRPSAVP